MNEQALELSGAEQLSEAEPDQVAGGKGNELNVTVTQPIGSKPTVVIGIKIGF